jgi:hypothetical protein
MIFCRKERGMDAYVEMNVDGLHHILSPTVSLLSIFCSVSSEPATREASNEALFANDNESLSESGYSATLCSQRRKKLLDEGKEKIHLKIIF